MSGSFSEANFTNEKEQIGLSDHRGGPRQLLPGGLVKENRCFHGAGLGYLCKERQIWRTSSTGFWPRRKGITQRHSPRSGRERSEAIGCGISFRRSKALLSLPTSDPTEIFASPDDLKLRSCMTLFSGVPGADPVFSQVLDKFFGGQKDDKTVSIVKGT